MPKDKKADDPNEQDAMRAEYDFSHGVRGVTAARYRQGVNIAVIDPDLRDVFPDSEAVNTALRALAPLLRKRQGRTSHRGPAAGPSAAE
jgi:hypothetical protein